MPDSMKITSKQNEPNPLFKKWLYELFEEAKAKNSKLTNILKEALNSISKYPVPLKSGAECGILKGFGKKLCLFLDQRLEVYYSNLKCEENENSEANSQLKTNGDNMVVEKVQIATENKENVIDATNVHNDTLGEAKQNTKKKKKNNMTDNLNGQSNKDKRRKPLQKSPKKYEPGFMTGSYAILVALLNNMKQNPHKITLTKEELIEKAQPFSEESFIRRKPDTYYTSWSSMRMLLTKKLVIKKQSKKAEFKLSDEGIKLTEGLLKEYENRDTTNDLINKVFSLTSQTNFVIATKHSRDATDVIELLPSSNDITLSIDKRETPRVEVWIEDHEAVRGPINLDIRRGANLAELCKKAEISFGIPIHLQKWIVGRTLCSDDSTSIESLAGLDFRTPFYLCLLELDSNKDTTKVSAGQHTPDQKAITATNENVYNELKLLECCALVPNTEQFECGVCIVEYSAGEGVVLKECVHTFCRECLSAAVKHCEDPEVACPATSCAGVLQEREIRALVSSEEYERWLARRLAVAESVSQNSFHCRTPDCTGWALCEPGVRLFPCPLCKHTNCVQCEATHEGMTCDQHRINTAINSIDDNGTKALLNGLIKRGEALACPECNTIIIKKHGCDWILCSACKTEICWVTRGRRWGPGGRGDNSGGCRCRVNRKRCHPACRDCH